MAAVLCLRQSKLGYALGLVSGTFWLWMATALNSFVRNGFERLEMLIRTGSVDRPDVLIAAPAAIATGALALFCVIGYARLPNKRWRDVAVMTVAAVIVPSYFLAIFAAFTPQYLEMFRRLVR